MKFLLALNTYKEVMDAVNVSTSFHKYLKKNINNIIVKPISDGGDAFRAICNKIFQLKPITYEITKAYNDDLMEIEIGYDETNSNIYVESAEILGLKIIPENERNPGVINSKGLGDLLKLLKNDVDNKKLKINNIYIGIGGTGTNDLALGACSRFGLRLFDNEKELEIKPLNYYKVKRIEWKKQSFPFKIIPVLDVKNKLLGKEGATMTYGKQKGAGENELKVIEEGFSNIINILSKMDMIKSQEELSGAGGGLAAGLSIFFNAETKKGKDFILRDIGIKQIKNVEYVLTGEGSFDLQSLMEKGSGVIINEFQGRAKKIFLVCGKIENEAKAKLNEKVYCIELVKYFNSKEESIKNFEKGIELACEEIMGVIGSI
jgi:glycerate kinase